MLWTRAFKFAYNVNMSDINEKVINIFKTQNNKQKNTDAQETEAKKQPEIKYFAGVSYVRLDEDVNGHPFNKEKLIERSEKFSYIVRVVKPKNGKYALYNYSVPYDKIIDFISMFSTNELSGTIIEIDKYKPNELA